MENGNSPSIYVLQDGNLYNEDDAESIDEDFIETQYDFQQELMPNGTQVVDGEKSIPIDSGANDSCHQESINHAKIHLGKFLSKAINHENSTSFENPSNSKSLSSEEYSECSKIEEKGDQSFTTCSTPAVCKQSSINTVPESHLDNEKISKVPGYSVCNNQISTLQSGAHIDPLAEAHKPVPTINDELDTQKNIQNTYLQTLFAPKPFKKPPLSEKPRIAKYEVLYSKPPVSPKPIFLSKGEDCDRVDVEEWPRSSIEVDDDNIPLTKNQESFQDSVSIANTLEDKVCVQGNSEASHEQEHLTTNKGQSSCIDKTDSPILNIDKNLQNNIPVVTSGHPVPAPRPKKHVRGLKPLENRDAAVDKIETEVQSNDKLPPTRPVRVPRPRRPPPPHGSAEVPLQNQMKNSNSNLPKQHQNDETTSNSFHLNTVKLSPTKHVEFPTLPPREHEKSNAVSNFVSQEHRKIDNDGMGNVTDETIPGNKFSKGLGKDLPVNEKSNLDGPCNSDKGNLSSATSINEAKQNPSNEATQIVKRENRKFSKLARDTRDAIKMPFVRRRNKAYLKHSKEDRMSCPVPETFCNETWNGEEKWKCKSFNGSAVNKENERNCSQEELMRRLEEQRRRTEVIAEESTGENLKSSKQEERENADEMEDTLLFDHVLVIKLRPGENGLEPYISFRFPPKQKYDEEMDPRVASIPQFCFPDLKSGMSAREYKEQRIGYASSETFSFVLTDMIGQRHFGYCRQIQIGDRSKASTAFQLPEVYCIVSAYGLFGLYSQILDEVERQCHFSSSSVFSFLKAVLSHSLPRPGHSVHISFFSGGSAGIESVDLKRGGDSAIHEHVDLKMLFSILPIDVILNVVSALLLERRIVLASSQLSLLSACCHGFISLLYPFEWQHTYIPVLPFQLLDMCCLPTPYLLGVLSACVNEIDDLPVDELMIIDLDNACVLRDDAGDRSSNFPTQVINLVNAPLEKCFKGNSDEFEINRDKERNIVITEIFIEAYLHLIGNFEEFYTDSTDDDIGFQFSHFSKASKSKDQRRFLKQFIKTQAFQSFIRRFSSKQAENKGLFEERLREWRISRKQKTGNESAWQRMLGKLKHQPR